MIKVGVIGYGYWGPNLVRNLAESNTASIAAVSDLRPERLALAAKRVGNIRTYQHYCELLADSDIDAVVVATPVSTHFDLALEALQSGKHVLVEKPLAATSEQAARLIDEAAKRRLVLMVDHTFVYTGAVRKIREIIAANQLGQIYYYDSVRVSLGLLQHDVNVIWDLAVHDLSIIDFVLPHRPLAVSATGMSHIAGHPENTAYLTLFFDRPLLVHVHVNWLAPVKLRRTLIGGSQRMVVYDDLEPSEKVKVYDKGVVLNENVPDDARYKILVSYRAGDMWAPQIDITEALKIEIEHFVECIAKGRKPETDGESGLRVVRILEAASTSMQERGKPVELYTGVGA
jgi:predicted dehydrogenase